MRHKISVEMTVDTSTGQVIFETYLHNGTEHLRAVLSPPTRNSDSLVAVKNDIPVAEVFNTARQVARFLVQTFTPPRVRKVTSG